MKKIIALFLMVITLSSLCIPTFADGDSFTFKATENVFAATGETSADGMIMLWGGSKIGFKVNSEKPVTSMMINYRTGAGSHGKFTIRLDDPNGPAIGSFNSINDAGDVWDYYI
ncbi:MAG: hypothetical protein IKB60_06030, partial [Clostridia bacterium]|nr:hypothetical protein [Clostridia bacterium]